MTANDINYLLRTWPNNRRTLTNSQDPRSAHAVELLGDSIISAITKSPTLPQRSASLVPKMLDLLDRDLRKKGQRRN